VSSNSPWSRHAKTVIEKLSKGLEGSLASIALHDEMPREALPQADGPSNTAIRGRQQPSEARVVDQDEVVALREA